MVEVWRGAVLLAATVATGLLAGLFYAFAVAVMPGLARTDARTFVDAMQQINVVIQNPWFFLTFFGAPVLTIVAAVLEFRSGSRAALPWIVAALVLYAVAFVITVAGNIPLNDALAAAGPPDRVTDLARVRARFETTWVRWNVARAVVLTIAFACLGGAQLVSRRGSPG